MAAGRYTAAQETFSFPVEAAEESATAEDSAVSAKRVTVAVTVSTTEDDSLEAETPISDADCASVAAELSDDDAGVDTVPEELSAAVEDSPDSDADVTKVAVGVSVMADDSVEAATSEDEADCVSATADVSVALPDKAESTACVSDAARDSLDEEAVELDPETDSDTEDVSVEDAAVEFVESVDSEAAEDSAEDATAEKNASTESAAAEDSVDDAVWTDPLPAGSSTTAHETRSFSEIGVTSARSKDPAPLSRSWISKAMAITPRS